MKTEIDSLIAAEEEWALRAVLEELFQAQKGYPDFVNAHEGFGVLREEVDELWAAVMLKQKDPARHGKMMAEARQVAAMALRFMIDLSDPNREIEAIRAWRQGQEPQPAHPAMSDYDLKAIIESHQGPR